MFRPQLSFIDLDDGNEKLRRVPSLSANEVGKTMEQLLLGEIGERVF